MERERERWVKEVANLEEARPLLLSFVSRFCGMGPCVYRFYLQASEVIRGET